MFQRDRAKLIVILIWVIPAGICGIGVEDEILDIDDLMNVEYHHPETYKNVVSANKNSGRFRFNSKPTYVRASEEVELSRNKPPLSNGLPPEKDKNPDLTTLEDLIRRPAWASRTGRARGESGRTKPSRDLNVDRLKSIQEGFRESAEKGDQLWASQLASSQEESNSSNAEKRPSGADFGPGTESSRFGFDQQSMMIAKALKEFYDKIFETLSLTVPRVKEEELYLTEKPISNDVNSFSKGKTNFNEFLEKKLSLLRNSSLKSKEGYGNLKDMMKYFPALLPIDLQSKAEERNKLASQHKQLFDSWQIGGGKEVKYLPERSEMKDDMMASYVPHIKHTYLVSNSTPRILNYTDNMTTPANVTPLWYYSNYYTEKTTLKSRKEDSSTEDAPEDYSPFLSGSLAGKYPNKKHDYDLERVAPPVANDGDPGGRNLLADFEKTCGNGGLSTIQVSLAPDSNVEPSKVESDYKKQDSFWIQNPLGREVLIALSSKDRTKEHKESAKEPIAADNNKAEIHKPVTQTSPLEKNENHLPDITDEMSDYYYQED